MYLATSQTLGTQRWISEDKHTPKRPQASQRKHIEANKWQVYNSGEIFPQQNGGRRDNLEGRSLPCMWIIRVQSSAFDIAPTPEKKVSKYARKYQISKSTTESEMTKNSDVCTYREGIRVFFNVYFTKTGVWRLTWNIINKTIIIILTG